MTEVRGAVALVTLRGELDMHAAADLEAELERLECEGSLDVVALDLRTHEAVAEHSDGRVGRVALTPDRPVGAVTRELLAEVHHDPRPVRDVDLLIRTGGEQRLSDFMLWECAYAELYFTQAMWPQFGEEELREALRVFESRERRFGGVPAQAAS